MSNQTQTPAPYLYAAEIAEAIRAGCRVIWTTTREEQRAEKKLITTAAALNLQPFIWTITGGLYDPSNGRTDLSKNDLMRLFTPDTTDQSGRQMFIIKDAAPYLPAAPELTRAIRDEITAGKRRPADRSKVFIFIDTAAAPDTIPGLYRAALEFPTRAELRALVEAAIQTLPDGAPAPDPDAITEALTGLDSETARTALNKSRVKSGTYNPGEILKEKRALIKSDALDWSEPDPRGLAAIGGLENLKADLMKFRAAISPDARAYGLPAPKGFLIAGIPGTGKTLTARAAAAAFGLPLVRLNISALMGKYVGESESNLRAALDQIRALAPVILHIDEMEKALSGASGSGDTDGGTTTRIFGELLTFMNDRTEVVFIMATANDITKLSPELKRAGRFDRVFFVDCPTRTERAAIARVMAQKFPRAATLDPEQIANATDGYTGAEIEEIFRTALYTAYNDGQRDATTADALEAAPQIVPIAKSESAALDYLRKWSETSARPASAPETTTSAASGAEFIIE